MKVKELIEKLQGFPPESEVRYFDAEWGALEIEFVQLAKDSYYYNYSKYFQAHPNTVIIDGE